MSATITWVIDWMDCKPTEGSYTDVVVNAGWRCNGVETAGTPSVDGVDKTAIEAGVQVNIDAQINPPIVQPPLPWATA